MATINKLASGKWRVQVRCKGHYLSTSFLLRKDAEMWARRIEREIDLGQKPAPKHKDGIKTVSDLIDLHIADMVEVGKVIGRSKGFSLDLLRARLGKINLADLSREQVIKFGKQRAEDGAGPVTVGIDIGYIRTLLVHGAAVHGLPYSPEPVELGRVALTRLGLVGKGNERDRRPTDKEIDAIIGYFEGNNYQIIPVDRMIRFAIATAMRLGIAQSHLAEVTENSAQAECGRLIALGARRAGMSPILAFQAAVATSEACRSAWWTVRSRMGWVADSRLLTRARG